MLATCDLGREACGMSRLLPVDKAATGNSDELQFSVACICEELLSAAISAWQWVSDAIAV